jgi:hypothetical protein
MLSTQFPFIAETCEDLAEGILNGELNKIDRISDGRLIVRTCSLSLSFKTSTIFRCNGSDHTDASR